MTNQTNTSEEKIVNSTAYVYPLEQGHGSAPNASTLNTSASGPDLSDAPWLNDAATSYARLSNFGQPSQKTFLNDSPAAVNTAAWQRSQTRQFRGSPLLPQVEGSSSNRTERYEVVHNGRIVTGIRLENDRRRQAASQKIATRLQRMRASS